MWRNYGDNVPNSILGLGLGGYWPVLNGLQ